MAPQPFLSNSAADIELIAQRLQQGGIFALPTETVYGLAADALNPLALEKIFKAKGRPHFDPLIIHISEIEQAENLALTNNTFYTLVQAFWPGPLTLILPKKPCVPDLATANRPTVALRMPAHTTFRRVLEACGRPLAAPSANTFGYVSPTTAQHAFNCLGDSIDGILDAGPCVHGIESTILDISDPSTPKLYRPGPISLQDLERALNTPILNQTTTPKPKEAAPQGLRAPGLLSKHYSPKTPIQLVELGRLKNVPTAPGTAHLYFQAPTELQHAPHVYSLSESGDLREAARLLYDQLRALDLQDYKQIIAEKAPGKELGLAINNRLKRAAKR